MCEIEGRSSNLFVTFLKLFNHRIVLLGEILNFWLSIRDDKFSTVRSTASARDSAASLGVKSATSLIDRSQVIEDTAKGKSATN